MLRPPAWSVPAAAGCWRDAAPSRTPVVDQFGTQGAAEHAERDAEPGTHHMRRLVMTSGRTREGFLAGPRKAVSLQPATQNNVRVNRTVSCEGA